MMRWALVTGSSSGIGLAVVECFRTNGWRVVGVDRVGPAVDDEPHHVMADVSSEADVARLFDEIGHLAGSLEAVVNCAASQHCQKLVETSVAEWDEQMENNVRSVFLLSRAAASFLAHGAAIVNVSSVHAVATSAELAAYAASKGAIDAFTRAAAVELAPRGIRVNAVLPGAVDTPMLRSGLARGHLNRALADDQVAELAARTPLARVADPSEIAQAVLFLADRERSSFITGSTLVVDGGATALLSTEAQR